MLPIYMTPGREFWLREKRLRPIRLFSAFALMRDASVSSAETAGAPAGAGVVSLSPDTIKAAQEAAGETVPVFVARAVEAQAQRDKSSLAMGINPATVTNWKMRRNFMALPAFSQKRGNSS